MPDKEKEDLDAIYVIQKQYLTDEGWSEWTDAFTFGTDLIATNDFFDVVQTCYVNAYSPEELKIVPHHWRIYNYIGEEVVEVSADVNFIHLSEFGSYDVGGVGPLPYWIDGSNRNIQENIKMAKKIMEEMIDDDEDLEG